MQKPASLDSLRALKPKILSVADKYGVSNIRVFGSVARGDADENSDVDLMIDMAEKSTLFDLVGFKQELEDMLDSAVDVVSIDAVSNPLRKQYMLADAVPL